MNKILYIVLVIFMPLIAVAQYSIGGGFIAKSCLNSSYNWNGLHAFVELPRTEVNTFYIRASLMLPIRSADSVNVTAVDFSVSPQQMRVGVNQRSTYFSIDGGNRTYFMNSYDAGIAPYFASQFRGILGGFSEQFSDFDETKYSAPSVFGRRNSVFIGMGVNIGLKYQLPLRGALTFDLGAEYIMTLFDNAQMMGAEFTPIGLFFNVAYRFDKF